MAQKSVQSGSKVLSFITKSTPKPTLDPLLGHFQPMTKSYFSKRPPTQCNTLLALAWHMFCTFDIGVVRRVMLEKGSVDWERESRGPKSRKSLEKVSVFGAEKSEKISKKVRKVNISLKMGYWRLFGPFSDFSDPGARRPWETLSRLSGGFLALVHRTSSLLEKRVFSKRDKRSHRQSPPREAEQGESSPFLEILAIFSLPISGPHSPTPQIEILPFLVSLAMILGKAPNLKFSSALPWESAQEID